MEAVPEERRTWMMHTSVGRVFGTVTAAAVVIASALLASPQAQSNSIGERFSAVAVDLDQGSQTQLEIVVERWSAEAQRQRLTEVLLNSGPEKLLEALQDAPKVGYIRTTTSLAWDLHFASHVPAEDGGERIVIATDRPVGFRELWNQTRSVEYPFTIVELRVDKSGEGDGTMSLATKVIPDKTNNVITIENYGTQRIRLQQVKRETAN
jgi:hypothetical protein